MKKRLDLLLMERGLVCSREKARALIMEGRVYVNGQKEDKPGTFFNPDHELVIDLRGDKLPFVSRGGLKLDKAVKVFKLNLAGDTCLDIGASTGGFTDCMLQNGADKVYAVDVGHGQLDYRLRNDPKVVCLEKTNFRYAKAEDFPVLFDFAGADVSFISLAKILPPAYTVLKDHASMVCLVKPQFEAGRDKVGKNGLVRDKDVHREVIRKVAGFAHDAHFACRGLDFSPIRGPKGNIEYLLFLEKGAEGALTAKQTADTVDRAHAFFRKDT